MVSDRSTDRLVKWAHDGCSFEVSDPTAFAKDVLPVYFKHSNFSSFVRQMNMYNFVKIGDVGEWVFQHQLFQRDRPELIKQIKRKAVTTPETSVKMARTDIETLKRQRDDLEEQLDDMRDQHGQLSHEIEQAIADNVGLRAMVAQHEEAQTIMSRTLQSVLCFLVANFPEAAARHLVDVPTASVSSYEPAAKRQRRALMAPSDATAAVSARATLAKDLMLPVPMEESIPTSPEAHVPSPSAAQDDEAEFESWMSTVGTGLPTVGQVVSPSDSSTASAMDFSPTTASNTPATTTNYNPTTEAEEAAEAAAFADNFLATHSTTANTTAAANDDDASASHESAMAIADVNGVFTNDNDSFLASLGVDISSYNQTVPYSPSLASAQATFNLTNTNAPAAVTEFYRNQVALSRAITPRGYAHNDNVFNNASFNFEETSHYYAETVPESFVDETMATGDVNLGRGRKRDRDRDPGPGLGAAAEPALATFGARLSRPAADAPQGWSHAGSRSVDSQPSVRINSRENGLYSFSHSGDRRGQSGDRRDSGQAVPGSVSGTGRLNNNGQPALDSARYAAQPAAGSSSSGRASRVNVSTAGAGSRYDLDIRTAMGTGSISFAQYALQAIGGLNAVLQRSSAAATTINLNQKTASPQGSNSKGKAPARTATQTTPQAVHVVDLKGTGADKVELRALAQQLLADLLPSLSSHSGAASDSGCRSLQQAWADARPVILIVS